MCLVLVAHCSFSWFDSANQTLPSEQKGLLPPCQDDHADAVEMPKGKPKVTSVVPEPASIGKASPKADAAAWTQVT